MIILKVVIQIVVQITHIIKDPKSLNLVMQVCNLSTSIKMLKGALLCEKKKKKPKNPG